MDEEMIREDEEKEAGSSEESKSDKFKRLAASRTNKILNTLGNLGNCSNRNSYEYTQEEVDKIFDTIQKKLDDTRAKFSPKESRAEEKFVL